MKPEDNFDKIPEPKIPPSRDIVGLGLMSKEGLPVTGSTGFLQVLKIFS